LSDLIILKDVNDENEIYEKLNHLNPEQIQKVLLQNDKYMTINEIKDLIYKKSLSRVRSSLKDLINPDKIDYVIYKNLQEILINNDLNLNDLV